MKTILLPIFLLSIGIRSTTAAPSLGTGLTVLSRTTNQKVCEDFKIPVTITSENFIFGLDHFTNQLDVANWVATATNRNPTIKKTVTPRTVNVTASYTIGATFCQPAPGKKSNKVVLLATHGIGFDKSYWGPALEDKDRYSFVYHAVSKGYSVFSYDRLGVGSSTHASGYVVQINNQLEILKVLAKKVKSGKNDVLPRGFGKPSKVVLLGHSFGSALSYFAVSDEPQLVDGIVLTGFSTNVSASNQGTPLITGFVPRIANLREEKWRGLDSGYLATVDGDSSAVIFFQQPDYDPGVAKFAAANQAPFAVMELSTGREFSLNPPVTFKGAALVDTPFVITAADAYRQFSPLEQFTNMEHLKQIITGKFDWPFCAGDCDGVLQNPSAEYFASARPFKSIVYPKAGHGINFHLNAKGSFQAITNFLGENGL